MAPIKVGIIGLSAKSGWAVSAHLPYLRDTSKYTITALCNSSIESARASIKAHSLPASTKAYGSPQDLAADDDIQLVVCSTRVDKHYETTLPALKAGRNCFVEWPLAANLEQVKELVDTAHAAGAQIIIGLQSQTSPVIKQLKKLVDSDRVGKLINVSIVAWGFIGGDTFQEGSSYALEKKVGGNMVSIAIGHRLDTALLVVGELGSLNAQLAIQRPTAKIVDDSGNVIRTAPRETPDYVAVQGKLVGSGATFTASIGGARPPKGQPMCVWHIEGEKAVVDITQSLFINLADDITVRVQDKDADEAETIKIEEFAETLKSLPYVSQVVGGLYEAYAEQSGGEWPNADWALMRHNMLDALYRSEESGSRTSYERV